MMNSHRVTIQFVISLITTLSLLFGAAAMAEPAQAASCADWLAIGLRGTGASYDSYDGMGPENYAIYRQIRSTVSGSFRSYGVPYRAARIDNRAFEAVSSTYWNSIAEGSAILGNRILSEIKHCPYQRLILLGYSQGADSLGDSLVGLDNNAAIRQHVAAISLLGDPDFNPSLPTNRGNYNKSYSGLLVATSITSPRSIPSRFINSTVSWCDKYDYICNWSASNFASHQSACNCGHFNYVNGGMARDIGNMLAEKMRGLPPLNYTPSVNPAYPTFNYRAVGLPGPLNVRSGPDLGAGVVGTIPMGGTAKIYCQTMGGWVSSSNIWNRIVWNGGTAWIADFYTDTPGPTGFSGNLPRCTRDSVPYWVLHVTGAYNPLNLRSAPSTAASVVGSTTPGSEIRVVCTVNGGWVGGSNGSHLWAYTNDGRWATGLGVDLPNQRETAWPVPQC